jgi:hypothetical protein
LAAHVDQSDEAPVKSALQTHHVLLVFAICHDEHDNFAIGVMFTHVFVYRLHIVVHVPFTQVDALLQLLAHERLIYPLTVLVPLTYRVSLFVVLSKFIPVV